LGCVVAVSLVSSHDTLSPPPATAPLSTLVAGVVHAWVGQIVTFFAHIVPLDAPRAP
jgi:hypothetical protein